MVIVGINDGSVLQLAVLPGRSFRQRVTVLRDVALCRWGVLPGVSEDRSAFVCVKAETSGSTRPVTRRHISEVRNPLQYRCENLESRIVQTGYKYQ
jgi:hypothetical protein